MTRFKELKRIEAAIKLSDQVGLEWAIGYCKTRLAIKGGFAHKKLAPRISRGTTKVEADIRFEAVLGKTHRTEF